MELFFLQKQKEAKSLFWVLRTDLKIEILRFAQNDKVFSARFYESQNLNTKPYKQSK